MNVELANENSNEHAEHDASGTHDPNIEHESRRRPTESEEAIFEEEEL